MADFNWAGMLRALAETTGNQVPQPKKSYEGQLLDEWGKRGIIKHERLSYWLGRQKQEKLSSADILKQLTAEDFIQTEEQRKEAKEKAVAEKKQQGISALVELLGSMQQPQADALNMQFPGSIPIAANNLPVNLGGMQEGPNPLMPQLQLGQGMGGMPMPQPQQQMTSNMGFDPNMMFRSQNMLSPQVAGIRQALQSGAQLEDIEKLGKLTPEILPKEKPNFFDKLIKEANIKKAEEEAKQAGIKTKKEQREFDIATGKIKKELSPEQEWKNMQYSHMLKAFPYLDAAMKNAVTFRKIKNPTEEQQKLVKEAEKQLAIEQSKADKEYKSQVSNIYKTAINIASKDENKKITEDQLIDEHLAKAIKVLSADPFKGKDYKKFLDIVQDEQTIEMPWYRPNKKVPASLIRGKIEYLNPKLTMEQQPQTQESEWDTFEPR